jgi:hypothetical protein
MGLELETCITDQEARLPLNSISTSRMAQLTEAQVVWRGLRRATISRTIITATQAQAVFRLCHRQVNQRRSSQLPSYRMWDQARRVEWHLLIQLTSHLWHQAQTIKKSSAWARWLNKFKTISNTNQPSSNNIYHNRRDKISRPINKHLNQVEVDRLEQMWQKWRLALVESWITCSNRSKRCLQCTFIITTKILFRFLST